MYYASADHLRKLRQGSVVWNTWRKQVPNEVPCLSDAHLDGAELQRYDLSGADLRGASLIGARLQGADLSYAYLHHANLQGARLDGAEIWSANLSQANLKGAKLCNSDLRATTLRNANLTAADFTGARLSHASISLACVDHSVFRGAQVYGLSAWSLNGKPKDTSGMIVYSPLEADVERCPRPQALTVDDLQTAQLMHLLLDNPQIARILANVNARTVLVLGRFVAKQKRILNRLRQLLLRSDFVPLLFDFAPPGSRDLTETVAAMAHLSCFVVADLTSARSIPQELSVIVPYLPSVPVVPIIESGQSPYPLFEHLTRYPWVQPVVKYRDAEHLSRIFRRSILERGYSAAQAARSGSLTDLRPAAPRHTPWPAVVAIDPRRDRPGYR